jgi:formylglycine-generating enzyme required for sulfatase activity
VKTQWLDDPLAMRRAGPDLLSLALIDSRNVLLQRLAQDESPAGLRLAAQAGWYQEYWLARHVQRQRGEACDATAPRLCGIEPKVDTWLLQADESAALDAPALRAYLAETLDITLELLAGTPAADAPLHYFRQSLQHEDRLGEAMAERLRAGAPPSRSERGPIWLPAQRWMLGTAPGPGGTAAMPAHPEGLVPHNERWAHEVAVPEFEIDAQAVNWARFVEFAQDGGYDRAEFWSAAGWAWVQAHGRRAPQGVEQLRGAVLVQRGLASVGAMRRAPAAQPVMHVARFEAEAWCRWAGRRLPTEPEWELAASQGAGMGFVWGDVFEGVAGSARAWPGAGAPAPGALDMVPAVDAAGGPWGVLRGASFATRSRWRHAKARRFVPLAQDTAFCGFRSCAS